MVDWKGTGVVTRMVTWKGTMKEFQMPMAWNEVWQERKMVCYRY